MTHSTTEPANFTGAAPKAGPMLAADGRPLKKSLARALRRQKLRALMLVAPLLIFVLVTFIAPIADMLFRSVENQIVSETLPETVMALQEWNGESDIPDAAYDAIYFDLFTAAEAKQHTRLGTRLNYEQTGISSLFRTSGRQLDDIGDDVHDALEDINPAWDEPAPWYQMMNAGDRPVDTALLDTKMFDMRALTGEVLEGDLGFAPAREVSDLLPRTAAAYTSWAIYTALVDGDIVAEEDPWESVFAALASDLQSGADVSGYSGPGADMLAEAAANLDALPAVDFRNVMVGIDEDWGALENWQTIKLYSPDYTPGYFLNSVDMQNGIDGAQMRPENERIYITLFIRTLYLSLVITGSCILLSYPVAFLLSNLPARSANLLMILVLLPFWTSLLVRTSAWKVMLQQQGVINDVLVWLGLVADDSRLVMINNQTGTIIAMTHILLPFMILPMYSVMSTIPPYYVRAAKSLGATNWTAFWRVYFPQSIPGIGAGSILVFILAIGYYITPEIVGGTKGVFISNRIAYHISSSLNWGLAAALGTILLAVVLILYWAYDRIVGIDNVKLG
ncbi:ABC transporter permease [Mesobacterium pallidum]|uniref:ABC transporter permease n=1 Tax=Mesobacterium pallidum TaxID=2872037 RepID=UPI001EE1E9A8|nr:ABC transporter permease [Mesobacterium pallidum]